jgi:hypothetical protein
LSLHVPWAHLIFTPFQVIADWITFNSARQDAALLAYLLAGYWAFRLPAVLRRKTTALKEAGLFLAWIAGAACFLAWAALWPRPAASLRAADPGVLVLDFHSHSSSSWDGRKSFTPEANGRWHQEAGFSAGFLTDHNRTDGSAQALELFRKARGYRSLFGEELSLHGAHVVALGPRASIDNESYRGAEGLRRFLSESRRVHGSLAVLSLPEYWKHHLGDLEELAGSGAAGIEIVNATPKGLDFPPRLRAEVVELCRRRGLFMAGATDNHGWARAAFVWNLMRLPGHAAMGPEELGRAVLDKLGRDGFRAVEVVARVKREPDEGGLIALDPFLGLWTLARSLSLAQALCFAAWLWLWPAARLFPPRRREGP